MKAHYKFAGFLFSIASVLSLLVVPVSSFLSYSPKNSGVVSSTRMNSQQERHPFCDLPGDPSLIIVTNVDLGDKKLDIMKGEERRTLASRRHK